MHRPAAVELPDPEAPPLARLGRRVVVGLVLIVFVAVVAYLDRGGYADADGSGVSLLDAFYYSTVSITTTGYGDIRPESDSARLLTTLLITPARILFLILLVGTTVELLAGRTRENFRLTRWRTKLRDHVIVCGYGTKGRAAIATMLAHADGGDKRQFVVIDPDPESREEARADGLATVAGDASRSEVLHAAGIHEAQAVVVAPDKDGAAVLITITAREHNPRATIVAAVREEENVHLLKESGANSVIVSSSSAGRLLGLATQAPQAVAVLEDLLRVGQGLDIRERSVQAHEEGPLSGITDNPVVAVLREGELMRFDDARASTVRAGDRIVQVCSVKGT